MSEITFHIDTQPLTPSDLFGEGDRFGTIVLKNLVSSTDVDDQQALFDDLNLGKVTRVLKTWFKAEVWDRFDSYDCQTVSFAATMTLTRHPVTGRVKRLVLKDLHAYLASDTQEFVTLKVDLDIDLTFDEWAVYEFAPTQLIVETFKSVEVLTDNPSIFKEDSVILEKIATHCLSLSSPVLDNRSGDYNYALIVETTTSNTSGECVEDRYTMSTYKLRAIALSKESKELPSRNKGIEVFDIRMAIGRKDGKITQRTTQYTH